MKGSLILPSIRVFADHLVVGTAVRGNTVGLERQRFLRVSFRNITAK